MSYWSSALGDTGSDYCGGRRTYKDAPTVRLVQDGLRELADKAVSGAAGIDRQLANVDPGPTDGVIRPQLTAAIKKAQQIAGHSCTDGLIDDWLLSALHLQPHLNPKDSTAPPAEIPNPAKGSQPKSGGSSAPKETPPAPKETPPSSGSGISTGAKWALGLAAAAAIAAAASKKRRT